MWCFKRGERNDSNLRFGIGIIHVHREKLAGEEAALAVGDQIHVLSTEAVQHCGEQSGKTSRTLCNRCLGTEINRAIEGRFHGFECLNKIQLALIDKWWKSGTDGDLLDFYA